MVQGEEKLKGSAHATKSEIDKGLKEKNRPVSIWPWPAVSDI